jgi:hypothetical protein
MTEKAQFDADEWERISRAPAIAAMYVITAEKGGTLRESMAVGKVYAEAREQSTGSALVDEIVASVNSVSPNEFAGKEQFRAEAVDQIRGAKGPPRRQGRRRGGLDLPRLHPHRRPAGRRGRQERRLPRDRRRARDRA